MNHPFIVIKLGGTSQCKNGYDTLIKYIINHNTDNTDNIIIVLSAVSGVTNLLDKFTKTKDISYIHEIEDIHDNLINSLYEEEPDKNYFENQDIDGLKTVLIKNNFNREWEKFLELIKNFTNMDDLRKRAEIIGFGEKLSTTIFTSYLKQHENFNSKSFLLNSYDFIKSTKETYKLYPSVQFVGDLDKFNEIIKESIKDNINNIYITQGFIASSPKGEPLLLGRGGSDTTGAIIANMVTAKYYEVWTDVEGIYTADPRLVDNVKHIKNISYDLIQELAAMGAKVMHPLSIIPCQLKSIPIYVKSTFNINGNNTKIHTDDFNDTCIAIQKNVSVFHMKSMDMWNSYGFVNDIFRRFSQNQVDVNIITTSQFSISTTTSETNSYILKDLEQELNKDYETCLVQNCVILSLVSNNVRKIMSHINFNEITSEIIHIGSNNLSINIVLKEKTNDELKEIISKMFI